MEVVEPPQVQTPTQEQVPDLVIVAVDLNVKFLAVITVRQHGRIQATRFVSDKGLDRHLWAHVRRQNKAKSTNWRKKKRMP